MQKLDFWEKKNGIRESDDKKLVRDAGLAWKRSGMRDQDFPSRPCDILEYKQT